MVNVAKCRTTLPKGTLKTLKTLYLRAFAGGTASRRFDWP